jgi:hypothetical protein
LALQQKIEIIRVEKELESVKAKLVDVDRQQRDILARKPLPMNETEKKPETQSKRSRIWERIQTIPQSFKRILETTTIALYSIRKPDIKVCRSVK